MLWYMHQHTSVGSYIDVYSIYLCLVSVQFLMIPYITFTVLFIQAKTSTFAHHIHKHLAKYCCMP